jgi:hypothetical protein
MKILYYTEIVKPFLKSLAGEFAPVLAKAIGHIITHDSFTC